MSLKQLQLVLKFRSNRTFWLRSQLSHTWSAFLFLGDSHVLAGLQRGVLGRRSRMAERLYLETMHTCYTVRNLEDETSPGQDCQMTIDSAGWTQDHWPQRQVLL